MAQMEDTTGTTSLGTTSLGTTSLGTTNLRLDTTIPQQRVARADQSLGGTSPSHRQLSNLVVLVDLTAVGNMINN